MKTYWIVLGVVYLILAAMFIRAVAKAEPMPDDPNEDKPNEDA